MTKFKTGAGALVLVAAFAAVAYAQAPAPTPPPSSMPGMNMQGPGGMMMDPVQMKRMMENCNKMMESMMRSQPTPAPVPDKKG